MSDWILVTRSDVMAGLAGALMAVRTKDMEPRNAQNAIGIWLG
jgi:hypothetical protein